MDVLVHLCDREGFGLALAEAGAAGVPVVAFGTAGAAEVVQNGRTGLLVPDPSDIDGLADRVLDLLANDDARRALGEAARLRVVQRFSQEAFVAAFCRLFRDVAGARGGRR